MVQDRALVAIDHESEVAYRLSNYLQIIDLG